MSEPAREHERTLTLDFECLKSIREGMNEVRVWHDRLLDCDRVGKRIDLSCLDSAEILPEPATLQAIDHPNVVEVLAAAQVDGFPLPMRVVEIVTPYYERGSITDALLRGESFKASEAVAITQAALRGLGHFHEVHGICHRDIKSGNVLLATGTGIAKVADLGLAGRFGPDGTVSAVNNPTLYSSWEFGQRRPLTRASDLYAMGLVLRELLAGPFDYAAYSTSFVVDRLASGRLPVRSTDLELPAWVPRSLRRVYRKSISKLPERRYQSAGAMDAALSRASTVDWVRVSPLRWEANFVRHRGRMVAIEARQLRNGAYRLSTLARGAAGSWRRIEPDVDLAGLTGSGAEAVFDQASQRASVR